MDNMQNRIKFWGKNLVEVLNLIPNERSKNNAINLLKNKNRKEYELAKRYIYDIIYEMYAEGN